MWTTISVTNGVAHDAWDETVLDCVDHRSTHTTTRRQPNHDDRPHAHRSKRWCQRRAEERARVLFDDNNITYSRLHTSRELTEIEWRVLVEDLQALYFAIEDTAVATSGSIPHFREKDRQGDGACCQENPPGRRKRVVHAHIEWRGRVDVRAYEVDNQ